MKASANDPDLNGWCWLDSATMVAVHEEQLAEHGGAAGIRDQGLFDSAMAPPVNLVHYASAESPPDAAQLAASYGFGLARNHPFMDGNKRTAFVAIELFLQLNGYVLMASDHDCVSTVLHLAAGELSEEDLATWLRGNMAALGA